MGKFISKFDKLVGVGCSFTEGGGLNNHAVYKYYNGIDINIELSQEENTSIQEFMYNNSYIAHLSKILNIPYENLSESQSSNELILSKVYDRFSNNTDKVLLIIQPTFYGRKTLWFEPESKFKKLSGGIVGNREVRTDSRDIDDRLADVYEKYLKYCYNDSYEEEYLYKNLDIYNSWLREKNVVMFILPWELNNFEYKTDKTILLDNMDLSVYSEKNKLRFMDNVDLNFNDMHLSLYGNKIIAEKIYIELKNTL